MNSPRPPCRFCQRSRWFLSITVLVAMATVLYLNLPA